MKTNDKATGSKFIFQLFLLLIGALKVNITMFAYSIFFPLLKIKKIFNDFDFKFLEKYMVKTKPLQLLALNHHNNIMVITYSKHLYCCFKCFHLISDPKFKHSDMYYFPGSKLIL